MVRRTGVAGLLALAAACATPSTSARSASAIPRSTAWLDSTLAALTLREKAAQMVWPFMLGDYVAED
jgi:hypothetical protein